MIRWIVRIVLLILVVIGAISLYGMLPTDATASTAGTDADADTGGYVDANIVASGISVPSLVGTAAAQESNGEQNEDEDNAQDDSDPEHQTTYEFSSDLRIVNWEWDDGTWRAEFEADSTTTITVYEVPKGDDIEEGGEPYGEDYTIRSDGTTTVEFSPPGEVGVQLFEDGSIFMQANPDRQSIQGPPSGDHWTPVSIVTGLLLTFGSIVASMILFFHVIDEITGGKKVF